MVSRLSSSLRRASASGFSPGALPALPQSLSAPPAPPSLAPLRLKTRSTSREEGAFASILDRQGSSSRPISPPAQGGCLKAPCALQTASFHPVCGAVCMEVTGLWDPSMYWRIWRASTLTSVDLIWHAQGWHLILQACHNIPDRQLPLGGQPRHRTRNRSSSRPWPTHGAMRLPLRGATWHPQPLVLPVGLLTPNRWA